MLLDINIGSANNISIGQNSNVQIHDSKAFLMKTENFAKLSSEEKQAILGSNVTIENVSNLTVGKNSKVVINNTKATCDIEMRF